MFTTRSTTQPTTILIVDDEIEQIKILRLSLRSKGYQVTAVSNVTEALAALNSSQRYDLVLTDYAMPDASGLEFLKEIRRSGNRIGVIMMTAYGEKKVLVDALRLRCDGFIEKPFTLNELVAEITHVSALKNTMENVTRRELADFVPMMVHQINNPLTAIVGNAELALHRDQSCDKTRIGLQRIIEATSKIKSINREILDLGKGLDQQNQTIDIVTIVHECLQSLEAVCQTRGVLLNTTLPTEACWVAGNQFGLEQLFRNLMHNAVEAMQDSAIKMLSVELSQSDVDSAIRISIGDTGCGIAGDDLVNVFTPYFTTKQAGTGLGLSVVKQIVSSHRGDIEVQSTVGKGTRFNLSFPISNQSEQEKTTYNHRSDLFTTQRLER